MRGKYSGLCHWLAKTAMAVSVTGLVLMTLIIGWQVFGRKVLNASPAWSESIALLLMLYFVLLGAAVGVREGFHLRFRLLSTLLDAGRQRLLERFINVLVGAFGLLMVWHGTALAEFTRSHVIPTLGISRSVAYWPFIVAGLLIALFALERIAAPLAPAEGEN